MKRSILNKTDSTQLVKKVTLLFKYISVLPVLFCILCHHQISNASPERYNITLAFTQDNDFSQQLISHLTNGFQNETFKLQKVQLHPPFNPEVFEKQNLIIAIGSQATQQLLNADTKKPILSLLISENISNALEKDYTDRNNWSRLLIDQPVERQFSFITHTLGQHKKVGVLLSPLTIKRHTQLTQNAEAAGHQLISRQVKQPEELLTALEYLSKETDVLFASLDPAIYNKKTLRSILLSSYRHKLPIIGFSRAYVKAGAIAAIYSNAEQISTQAIRLTKEYFKSNSFDKKHYYPEDFSILLNHNVARSLGLSLPEDSAITEQIKLSEKNP